MVSHRYTGKSFFRRNWLGFLILYIEIEETHTDISAGSSHETKHTKFRKANEEDLIEFNLTKA